MTKRLRLVSVVLQPVFMVDDGDTLEPLQVHPLNISAADWGDVHAHFAAAVEQFRSQIEGVAEAPGTVHQDPGGSPV